MRTIVAYGTCRSRENRQGRRVASQPLRVRWTDHAFDKAALLSVTRLDVERTVLEQHHARSRNYRGADWRVASGRLVIAYDHPDLCDSRAARVVTLWRRR